jgi:hypothetical protein
MMNNSSMNMEMTSTMKANNRSRPRNLNPEQRRNMNNGVYE